MATFDEDMDPAEMVRATMDNARTQLPSGGREGPYYLLKAEEGNSTARRVGKEDLPWTVRHPVLTAGAGALGGAALAAGGIAGGFGAAAPAALWVKGTGTAAALGAMLGNMVSDRSAAAAARQIDEEGADFVYHAPGRGAGHGDEWLITADPYFGSSETVTRGPDGEPRHAGRPKLGPVGKALYLVLRKRRPMVEA